ncbi:hypothetical protein RERY_43000 [Rhodococcus erythropolis]|jgi:hypothetical protein|nr:hypothetical protein RERY_43000 [Rhodococcus erythropolis]
MGPGFVAMHHVPTVAYKHLSDCCTTLLIDAGPSGLTTCEDAALARTPDTDKYDFPTGEFVVSAMQ